MVVKVALMVVDMNIKIRLTMVNILRVYLRESQYKGGVFT